MERHISLITQTFDTWTNALVLNASIDILTKFVDMVSLAIDMCIDRMRQDGRDISDVESRRFELLELMRDIEGCTHPNITCYIAYAQITDAVNILIETIRQPPEECSICMDIMHGIVAETDCQHRFHRECLGRWLESHNTCPICRRYL